MPEALPVRSGRALAITLLIVAATALLPAQAQQQLEITPVSDASLLNPPPEDWLMWRRTLDSWGYSPLRQIDGANVNQLQLVWTRGLEPGGPQEGTPLVHAGVL